MGTSGLILVARSQEAYQGLTTALAERRVKKIYLGMVFGVPRESGGTVEAPIGRHPRDRKTMAVIAKGRPAVTHWETLREAVGFALLRLDLETGRTHQIRVHLKELGHPLVGDATYGGQRWKGAPPSKRALLRDFQRPALHAWRLALEHPVGGVPLELEAPIPLDLRELWQAATGSDLPAL
jgi:23S rRNA pseudouridine1911/1915/1917 synthase